MRTILFLVLLVIFSFLFNAQGIHSSLLHISMDYADANARYFTLELNLLPFIVAGILVALPYKKIYETLHNLFSKSKIKE